MNYLSRYAHFIELDGHHYLYNASNSIILELHPTVYNLIAENKNNIDKIKQLHPDLFDCMLDNAIIVADREAETKELVNRFRSNDNKASIFGITINPTLDCNLRCWYCYETHAKGSMMSAATMASVTKLINSKVTSPNLKRLTLSFFGGEPLIGWKKVVSPLLSYASNECKTNEVSLKTSFTTNGVLLSNQIFDALAEMGLGDTGFQISIDGSRLFHDNSRVGTAKIPTYDTIINNVASGAKRGFNIILRFNYTPQTLYSFVDVLSDLLQMPAEVRQHIQCSFHQVWQTTEPGNILKESAEKIVGLFNEEGINANSDYVARRSVCYADRENHVVINYNGDLYKCTAREFLPHLREGVLSPSGELLWNDHYRLRMKMNYAHPVCLRCAIMPICNGNCSQTKLEHHTDNKCPRGMSDKEQQKYLIRAFRSLLTSTNNAK